MGNKQSQIVPFEFNPPEKFGPDPNDSRFFCSFRADQVEEYKAFFQQCGFVVVDGIFDEQRCDDTINAIWKEIEKMSFETVTRNDLESWGKRWPASKTGILGSGIICDQQAFDNRQSPELYEVFKNLYNEDDLLVSLDRYGAMRPTKDVPDNQGELHDRPEWYGLDSWFHWDLNPWWFSGVKPQDLDKVPRIGNTNPTSYFISENNSAPNTGYDKLQGLVALEDTSFETGGFQCVPGFQTFLKQWATQNQQHFTPGGFIHVPQGDNLVEQTQVIALRKGSVVIWSSNLPHCNRGNKSSSWRYCQYIKMIPTKTVHPDDLSLRAQMVSSLFPKDFLVSDHGQKVFGLQYLPQKQ